MLALVVCGGRDFGPLPRNGRLIQLRGDSYCDASIPNPARTGPNGSSLGFQPQAQRFAILPPGPEWGTDIARGQPRARFIIAAAYPAPKPLSMLTTVTPGAHELSMPSRAAMPPKLAP